MKKDKKVKKNVEKLMNDKSLDSVSGGMFIAKEFVEKINKDRMVCAGTYEVCSGIRNRGPLSMPVLKDVVK